MTSKLFYTTSEVMQVLSISYPTLIRKVKAKEIPFVRVGRALRFPCSYFESLEHDALANVEVQNG